MTMKQKATRKNKRKKKGKERNALIEAAPVLVQAESRGRRGGSRLLVGLLLFLLLLLLRNRPPRLGVMLGVIGIG